MIQRICHINLSRGFRGGERQSELLINELGRQGVPQRAVVHRGGALARRLASLPGLDLRTVSSPFLHQVGLTRHALLHAHEARAMHMAHLSHRILGVPYIYTRRVDDLPHDRYLTRQAYRRAGAVVAISAAIRDKLISYSPDLEPAVTPSVAPQTTRDPGKVAKLRERWNGKLVIGHAGALVDKHKGQITLIDAARLLGEMQAEMQFVLLGQGRDEAMLKQQAQKLNHVTFEGQVEDLTNYLAAMDIFAFPSRHEGLGSVLLEAMNAGLPVVASDVDGIPELVEQGVTGLLVPPNDARALAGAIETLAGDRAMRTRMGKAGQARAAQFTPARMANAYIEIYRPLAPALFS